MVSARILVLFLFVSTVTGKSLRVMELENKIIRYLAELERNETMSNVEVSQKRETEPKKYQPYILDPLGLGSPLLGEQNLNDEERQRRASLAFEKMLRFITVVGQVDNFLSDKAKSFIRTLNRLVDGEDSDS